MDGHLAYWAVDGTSIIPVSSGYDRLFYYTIRAIGDCDE